MLNSTAIRIDKRLLLATIALSAPLLAGSAMAADLPLKAAPTAPAYSWSGCYIGVNGGGAASGSDTATSVDPGTHLVNPADLATVGSAGTGSANGDNFIGGGQAGCNWQTGTMVLGLEGDWDYVPTTTLLSPIGGTLSTGDTFSLTNSVKTNWLATIRPRVGVAVDRNLAYVTGGAAFAEYSLTQTYADTIASAVGSSSVSRTVIGWTAGAGLETAVTNNVTLKVEYLFAQFPSIAATGAILGTDGGTNVLHGSADLTVQTLRIGMNYKF